MSKGLVHALLWGTRSNMKWDFWGHSGRQVSIACLVDFRTRTVRPLPAFFAAVIPKRGATLQWGATGRYLHVHRVADGLDLAVVDLRGRRSASLGSLRNQRLDHCALREVNDSLVVACITHRIPPGSKTWDSFPQDLLVQRFSLRSWPPVVGAVRRIGLGPYGSPGGSTLSRTGRYLAHFATSEVKGAFLVKRRSHIGVVDLRTGRHRLRRVEVLLHRKVIAVELSPDADSLLIGEYVGSQVLGRSRVRRLRLDGPTQRAHALPWILHRLYWPRGSAGYRVVGSCESRRLR